MSVIAVAGKMASGKNFICSQMEKEGWCSVDADLLVHDAVKQSAQLIFDTFKDDAKAAGIDFMNGDGSVNRRQLGKLLFGRPDLLAKQEAIVYPIIIKMVKDFVQTHSKTVINATVLYKTPELLSMCDYILYVKSPFLKRLYRARKRDHLPYKQIFKRFHAQKDLLKQYKQTGKKIVFVNN